MTSTPFELALPREVSAPGIARCTLNEWFATFADDEFDTAKLLASELVTNAVLHGQGTIMVRADLDEDRLLVEVLDEGTGFERTARDGDFEKPGGWGLGLVDSESSRWGIQAGTTHVWFELDRIRPPARARDATSGSSCPGALSRPPAPSSTAHALVGTEHASPPPCARTAPCSLRRAKPRSILWTRRSPRDGCFPLLSCSLRPGLLHDRDRRR